MDPFMKKRQILAQAGDDVYSEDKNDVLEDFGLVSKTSFHYVAPQIIGCYI